jgi:hypothetical protein
VEYKVRNWLINSPPTMLIPRGLRSSNPGPEATARGKMNTRGLMELIALNIGYELGILSPRNFTMLVIMALVTTVMTGPMLTLLGIRQPLVEPDREPSRA